MNQTYIRTVADILTQDRRASIKALARALEYNCGCPPERSYQAVITAVSRLRKQGLPIKTLLRRYGQTIRTTYIYS